MDSEIVRFKTNTLLKNLVGRDLINDDNLAIVELVKNAHDARSNVAIVRFENLDSNGTTNSDSRLLIIDNGTGMTRDDIKDKWLNIAYSEKKLLKQPTAMHLAGNKGIGRFSCDRLGTELVLLTRHQGHEILHLPISWAEFEKEGQKDSLIQDVSLEVSNISELQACELANIESFPETGTVLLISNLRSQWDRERFRNLKNALERFQNPNQFLKGNQFSVRLEIPVLEPSDAGKAYHDRITGEIQNQIFEDLKFGATYIAANIFGNENQVLCTTNLHHQGEEVFSIEETLSLEAIDPSTRVHAIIYFLNPYKKAYFKKQTGVRSVDFGSVFLFLNGFRVAPYGDRGDDWLGLDVRKSQGQQRYLGTRDIVGRIEIVHYGDEFTPVSSREGLKSTLAFRQLKSFVLYLIKRLERFVVDGLNWDSVPSILRQNLSTNDGLDWERTTETYAESWDLKQKRIALDIMGLVGITTSRLRRVSLNARLLEVLAEQRTEETRRILSDIQGLASDKVDKELKSELVRVQKLIASKEAEVRSARETATALKIEVAEKSEELERTIKEKDTLRAQSLFLQSVQSLDAQRLVQYHHQILNFTATLENYLRKVISLDGSPSNGDHQKFLHKAILTNQKIASIARFATKANFRVNTKDENTDVPRFVKEYIERVAKEYLAPGTTIEVINAVDTPFELRVRRIELIMLIDNIINNAYKAQATQLMIKIALIKAETIRISFSDNGVGLSNSISNVEDIFTLGFTTTSGSGIGLYQAKQLIDALGGVISAHPVTPRGLEIRVEVTR